VIDELMGHEATGRSDQHRGSAMGVHYRHTTPEMAARVIDAIQQRLAIVLRVAELALENARTGRPLECFDRRIHREPGKRPPATRSWPISMLSRCGDCPQLPC
jgi:hypothetical protein